MNDRDYKLSLCPVCSYALRQGETRCARCCNEVVEDADLIDVSERRLYRERLAARRAAWTELETALHESLREFGPGWGRGERWSQFWARVRELASRAELTEYDTQVRASDIWREIEQTTAEPPPPPDYTADDRPFGANLVRIREWVAALPDGEVNASDWVDFVKSLAGPSDPELLTTLRDQEIERLFPAFVTVQVDAAGNLGDTRRARVRQFVDKLDAESELALLSIRGGEFLMGSERYGHERPVHLVRVADFYLGRFPVTQAQWRSVARLPKVSIELGENDSAFRDEQLPNLPVECVSWPEAVEFCARLASATGRPYRLPSEAEWEYACRAGSTTDFAFGPRVMPQIVNYDGSLSDGLAAGGLARRGTVAVGSLNAANGFGLYDMHGNVSEWCADEWHDNYVGGPADGSAWVGDSAADFRVVRGGSWAHAAEVCRSSDRSRESAHPGVKLHYLGFRVALSRL